MTSSPQLSLAVHLRDEATLENFLFPPQPAPLRSALEQLSAGEGEGLLYLWGAPGSGRSHLLQAVCQALPSGRGLYLPLEQLGQVVPADLLADVEMLQVVCLDNLDAVAGRPAWEEALFHLINRARQNQCQLLCSAGAPPAGLGLDLADLVSRLAGGTTYRLPDCGDEEKLGILRFRAARRGMQLSDEAGRFILARAPRALGELLELLRLLDKASMVAKRPLSIPFIKQTLGW